MTIETWLSDKNNEEVHHFIDGTKTFVFGINPKLLGLAFYSKVLNQVKERLEEIEHDKRRNYSE